jgi:hypothetical protein
MAEHKAAYSTDTKTKETGEKSKREERGMYHMDRWLSEKGNEEAWSVYTRR